MTADLHIAEIPFDTGEVRFRYARLPAPDGKRWIRHGPFREYARNGHVICEGNYKDGKEDGVWRDYYENGQIAAEGRYENGHEVGEWRFWDLDGRPTDKPVRREGAG